MFERLAILVERRSWLIIAGWAVFAATLWWFAPKWEEVSRDDDVRFFPAGSPTVIGQDLLQRGFPESVASSQAVVIAERKESKLTPADLNWLDGVTEALIKLSSDRPGLGIRQVLDRRNLMIGTRLVGNANNGNGQASLIIVMLKGTYLARTSREAVKEVSRVVEEYGQARPAPAGLSHGITGSAAVGRDMNSASDESIANTTTATIALVVAILLIVYRSPLLALIPLLTIGLSPGPRSRRSPSLPRSRS